MKRPVGANAPQPEAGAISKMVIVDTFTRLIFGDVRGFNVQEQAIIEALRRAEPNVTGDSHREMGDYLRALGVAEMISLVARVEQACSTDAAAVVAGEATAKRPWRQRGLS